MRRTKRRLQVARTLGRESVSGGGGAKWCVGSVVGAVQCRAFRCGCAGLGDGKRERPTDSRQAGVCEGLNRPVSESAAHCILRGVGKTRTRQEPRLKEERMPTTNGWGQLVTSTIGCRPPPRGSTNDGSDRVHNLVC
jgi:hypothetical protein